MLPFGSDTGCEISFASSRHSSFAGFPPGDFRTLFPWITAGPETGRATVPLSCL
jgi:hypothetical protein